MQHWSRSHRWAVGSHLRRLLNLLLEPRLMSTPHQVSFGFVQWEVTLRQPPDVPSKYHFYDDSFGGVGSPQWSGENSHFARFSLASCLQDVFMQASQFKYLTLNKNKMFFQK